MFLPTIVDIIIHIQFLISMITIQDKPCHIITIQVILCHIITMIILITLDTHTIDLTTIEKIDRRYQSNKICHSNNYLNYYSNKIKSIIIILDFILYF